MGPVACPVGDPPFGSSETARIARALSFAAFSLDSGIDVDRSDANTPNDIGLLFSGINQSSVEALSATRNATAGTTTISRFAVSIVIVQCGKPFSSVMAAAM